MIVLVVGCNPLGSEKSKLSFKTPENTGITVSKIEVINNQLIISGSNLSDVNKFEVKDGGSTTTLEIESVTNTSIVANTLANLTLATGKVFDFILSSATAAATYQVTIGVADNTITAPMLTSMGANTGQVMKYNGSSWVASSMASPQTYMGTWNATTNIPNLTIPSATSGDYYIVSTGGTFNTITYAVGDWIISDGSSWQKIAYSTSTGNPAGGASQVQFNNSGIFGANPNFTWDNTNSRLGVGIAAPIHNLSVVGTANITGAVTLGTQLSLNGGSVSLGNNGLSVASGNIGGIGVNVGGASWAGGTLYYGSTASNAFTGFIYRGVYTGTGSGRVALFQNTNAAASGDVLTSINAGIGNTAKFTGLTYTSVIDSSGKLGIANSSPGTLLHVGSAAIAAASAVANFQTATGTCTMTPATSGNGIACSSDVRLKKNIEEVDKNFALSKITKLKAVTYEFRKENTGKRHTGYIAQQVNKIAPEFVRKGEDGFFQIYYDGFIPWITESIKELHNLWSEDHELVARQAEEIEILKARLDRLEKMQK